MLGNLELLIAVPLVLGLLLLTTCALTSGLIRAAAPLLLLGATVVEEFMLQALFTGWTFAGVPLDHARDQVEGRLAGVGYRALQTLNYLFSHRRDHCTWQVCHTCLYRGLKAGLPGLGNTSDHL